MAESSYLADSIKQARKLRGMTQDQLAEKLDCSLDVVSNIERNKTSPTFLFLEKIAEVLEYDLGDITARYDSSIPKSRLQKLVHNRFLVSDLSDQHLTKLNAVLELLREK